jgi:hypothetical protein
MSTITEYGLFIDEGCTERGYWTREAAERDAGADETVRAMCPDHDDQAADFCEECEERCDECGEVLDNCDCEPCEECGDHPEECACEA